MNFLSIKKNKFSILIHKKRVDYLTSILKDKYSLSRTKAKSYSKFIFCLETVFSINHEFLFTNEIFFSEGYSHTVCINTMKFLKDNGIITVFTPLITDVSNKNIRRGKSTFISLNLNFPKETYCCNSFEKYEFKNISNELHDLLCNALQHSNSGFSNKLQEETIIFSEQAFCNRYMDLSYTDLLGNFDLNTSLKMKTPAYHTKKSPYRYYHYFHTVPKENRYRLRLDNEEIIELFDIHNCMLLMINFLLPAPNEYFERLTLSGKIYETICDYVNTTYGTNWDRDFTKTATNKYLNISNWKIDRAERSGKSVNQDAFYVSEFFKNECPAVYTYIRNSHQCNSKDVYKNFTVHLEKYESYLIVDVIIKELWEKYHVKAISLHDSIWCKNSDYSKLINKYSVIGKIKEELLIKRFKNN